MPYTKEQVEHINEVLDSILIEAHKAVSRLHIHVSDRAPLMAAYVNAAATLLAAQGAGPERPVFVVSGGGGDTRPWIDRPRAGSPGALARGA